MACSGAARSNFGPAEPPVRWGQSQSQDLGPAGGVGAFVRCTPATWGCAAPSATSRLFSVLFCSVKEKYFEQQFPPLPSYHRTMAVVAADPLCSLKAVIGLQDQCVWGLRGPQQDQAGRCSPPSPCQCFRQVLNHSRAQPLCNSRYSQHPACHQLILPLSHQRIQQWPNLLSLLESQPLPTSFLLTLKYRRIPSPILLHSWSRFKIIRWHGDYFVFILLCLVLFL